MQKDLFPIIWVGNSLSNSIASSAVGLKNFTITAGMKVEFNFQEKEKEAQ